MVEVEKLLKSGYRGLMTVREESVDINGIIDIGNLYGRKIKYEGACCRAKRVTAHLFRIK